MKFSSYNVLPEVIKNLIIINGLFFLATIVMQNKGVDLVMELGLFSPESPLFKPYQFITHMFMHGSFSHILFNMFSLWMFGSVLENIWGGKRFLIFYILTGLGASALYLLVKHYETKFLLSGMSDNALELIKTQGVEAIRDGMNFTDLDFRKLNSLVNGPMIGASGAVYGILMAYGIMFPNNIIYLYFAIPIKVKYFMIGLIAYELYSGFKINDNVANFAHLGGMLIGFILMKNWNKQNYI